MSEYLEREKQRIAEYAKRVPKTMKIDRRRSKEKMLRELEELLGYNASIWQARKKNPWGEYENTAAAGKHEALAEARTLLSQILKKGK